MRTYANDLQRKNQFFEEIFLFSVGKYLDSVNKLNKSNQ